MTIMRCEFDGKLAVITMTNQAKRNVLSEEMIEGILDGLKQAEQAKARTVILRAEPGCKVWSAGHDVVELPATHRDPLGWGDPLRVVIRAIEEFPAPVIARFEGRKSGHTTNNALLRALFADPRNFAKQTLS